MTSVPVWAREPVGALGVESPAGVAATDEESMSGVWLPEAEGVAPPVPLRGLPGLEGEWVGLCVGLSEGSGFGSVAVLALVTVTVTGAPGPAVNVFVGL
ncbi:hypothetical protein [Streptomyces sp. NPDC095613]|uniref:hypothetical protein n=1 Tax=Streptomyces sp. NPDC095613 TaxID=3155540 RepID=UPI00331C5C1E